MTTEEDEAYKRNQAEAYCNHIRGLRHRKDVAEMDVAEAEQTLDGLGAVRYDREGGKTYVYLIKGSGEKKTYQRRQVTTGLSDGINIEVKSGLSPKDRVRGRKVVAEDKEQ